ncbi:MAG TPA: hypothetical protein VHB68_14755 [Steroidobacteraceae bacterium]|nr:hypothetical protein [Steroidobacteraceae bacterium]
MSTPTALQPEQAAPAARSWLASDPWLRMLQTLIRRELWEHRLLWMAPLVVSALLLVCALLTHGALKVDTSDSEEWLDPQNKVIVFALSQWALTVPQYLVMILVQSFYLVDCLYAERRDRSILFWKSLPVSDGATVASKLIVGCIVLPFGTYFLALVTDVAFTAIWNVRALIFNSPELVAWNTVAFLKTQALMFMGLVISILWYAPYFACLVLASACVRRNVLLWVTLVPLLAVIGERIAFGTHYIANLLSYRANGIWGSLRMETAVIHSLSDVGEAVVVSVPRLYDNVRIGPAFTNIDLWLGVLFAAACAFVAARVRRYRDES